MADLGLRLFHENLLDCNLLHLHTSTSMHAHGWLTMEFLFQLIISHAGAHPLSLRIGPIVYDCMYDVQEAVIFSVMQMHYHCCAGSIFWMLIVKLKCTQQLMSIA